MAEGLVRGAKARVGYLYSDGIYLDFLIPRPLAAGLPNKNGAQDMPWGLIPFIGRCVFLAKSG
jgi:hypothetical protein